MLDVLVYQKLLIKHSQLYLRAVATDSALFASRQYSANHMLSKRAFHSGDLKGSYLLELSSIVMMHIFPWSSSS
jgi:hypothetical protein